jgi:hypothetical protein
MIGARFPAWGSKGKFVAPSLYRRYGTKGGDIVRLVDLLFQPLLKPDLLFVHLNISILIFLTNMQSCHYSEYGMLLGSGQTLSCHRASLSFIVTLERGSGGVLPLFLTPVAGLLRVRPHPYSLTPSPDAV